MFLPSDYEFSNFLKDNHDIDLTPQEIQELMNFQSDMIEYWQLSRPANVVLESSDIDISLNTIYEDLDIQAGRVLAAVAFAALGFFLAPVLGIGALTGALIGASIGWRLFGGGDKKQQQRSDRREERTTQTFGFNSAPAIAPIGGVVPLVFTNTSTNPKGGVRSSGVVIHSRVETWGGVQRLFVLYGLCLGVAGEIDESSILISNQPRDTFFQDELVTISRLGTTDQSPFAEFPYYSQCISVGTNNQLGISRKGKYIGTTTTSTTVSVEPDSFDAFSPTDRYNHNSQDFRIVSKNQQSNSFQSNIQLNLVNNGDIFAMYRVSYETSKPCTEIHLNIVANLWARDENNNLLAHGCLFRCLVDGQDIGRFLLANKSEADIRRRIIIRNLTFTKHRIDLVPLGSATGNMPVYRLSDNQQVTQINTGVIVGGREIRIEFENSPTFIQSESETNSLIFISNTNKKQTSADRGAVAQLTTVNEIVYPFDLGHGNITVYPGVTCGALVVTASNRLQSDPQPSWRISRGTVGRSHIAAGEANISSTDTVLSDLTADFINYGIQPNSNFILRNLDQGLESQVTVSSPYQLTTNTPVFWKAGDRYLVYQDNVSLNYFPDIYVHTLTQRNGGLGGLLRGTQLADYFVDYPSIVRSRRFCIDNNFYWDGVVDAPISWASWASQESMSSLLFPTRIGGKFGLVPEQQTNPVMLFNASNILPDSYYEEYIPKQRLNTVHITYTDNSNDSPRDKTVTILTTNARNGNEAIFPESIRLPAVTNENQAIRVGQIYLNSRIMQDRVIGFSTALQGYGLREGDLIIVQHITTEVEKECSGFVIETQTYNSGIQRVLLSSPTSLGFGTSYSAAIFRLDTSTIQKDLVCVGVRVGNPAKNWIEIQGLNAPLSPPRENLTGDYVVVGRDTTHRRTYRVQKIEPQENGSVSITAVLWVPEILTFQNPTIN